MEWYLNLESVLRQVHEESFEDLSAASPLFAKLLKSEISNTWDDPTTRRINKFFDSLSRFVSDLKRARTITEELVEHRSFMLAECKGFVGPENTKRLVCSFFDAADALFHWKERQPYLACRLLRRSQMNDNILVRKEGLGSMSLHRYQTCQNYIEVMFKSERYETAVDLSLRRADSLVAKLHSLKAQRDVQAACLEDEVLLVKGSIAEALVRYDQWTSRPEWSNSRKSGILRENLWADRRIGWSANGFSRVFVSYLQVAVSGRWHSCDDLKAEDWSCAFATLPSCTLIVARNLLKLSLAKPRDDLGTSDHAVRLANSIERLYKERVTCFTGAKSRAVAEK